MHDEENIDLTFHQPTIFENNTQPTFTHLSTDDQVTPTQRPSVSNTLNKRSSNTIGQCPFSAHRIEAETSAK